MAKYLGPHISVLKNLFLKSLPSFYNKNNNKYKNINVNKSNFFISLKKKLFIKYYYNIRDKQLNKYLKYIDKKIGFKNIEILLLLEKRIDFILFQYYITKSISESRKYILEKKIFINNYCVLKPSLLVSIGDIIISYKKNNNINIYYNYYVNNNYSILPKSLILKKNFIKLLILRHSQPFELGLKLYL